MRADAAIQADGSSLERVHVPGRDAKRGRLAPFTHLGGLLALGPGYRRSAPTRGTERKESTRDQ